MSYSDPASHKENQNVSDAKTTTSQVEDCEKAVDLQAEDGIASHEEEPPVIASANHAIYSENADLKLVDVQPCHESRVDGFPLDWSSNTCIHLWWYSTPDLW